MSEALGRAQPRPRDHGVALLRDRAGAKLCSVNACLRVLGLSLAFIAASAQARAAKPALRLRLTAGRTTYERSSMTSGNCPNRPTIPSSRWPST